MAYAPAGMLTTTGSLTHLATVWYNKKALDQLKQKFRFLTVTEPDILPKRSGKTVQWFRYTLLAAKTSAASEGAVGTSNALTSTVVTASVSEYADFITVSTLLQDTAIDPIVQNAAEQLGYSAGLSVDTLVRLEFDSAVASVEQAPIAGADAAGTVNDLRKAKALLEGANVLPRSGDDFVCILHPYALYDITSDNAAGGFIDVMKYAAPVRLLNGEAGRVSGVRIVSSTNVKISTNYYYAYVVGKGAVGAVDLAGSGPSKVEDPAKQSFRINVINGGPQIADPEGMIGAAVSYRFVFVSKILDSTVYRYRMIKFNPSIV